MFYVDRNKNPENPVHPNYREFGNPFVTSLDESITDSIVVLETKSSLLSAYPNAKKYLWWQSVDNFFISHMSISKRILKWLGFYPIDIKKEEKNFRRNYPDVYNDTTLIHLVQSEYARIFLTEAGVPSERICNLTDYVEDEIVQKSKLVKNNHRENIVLYNPKKGYRFTKKIIEASSGKDYAFLPLENMTKNEVINNLSKAKLYIDFGNHPGKDRFPREAALCGCCIITGRRGAANNDVDIPISSGYKIEDADKNIPLIVDTIDNVMRNYQTCYREFDTYRNKILQEKEIFKTEALTIFG